MIKILLVDDHVLIRSGVSAFLSNFPVFKVIGEVKNGEEALHFIKDKKTDVIIMDLSMPGMGGMEATRKILRIYPKSKILVLSASESSVFSSRLLQAGALGYVTKGEDIHELIEAIKIVAHGDVYLSPCVAELLALRELNKTEELSSFDDLSERELQIAIMLAKGIDTHGISEKLYLSEKTVAAYRYRILSKLNVSGNVELSHLMLRNRLILEGDIAP